MSGKSTLKGQYSHYLCSDAFNNTLQGDFYSKDFKYVKIALKKCVGGKTAGCQRDRDALRFIRNNKMKIIYKDSNKDF